MCTEPDADAFDSVAAEASARVRASLSIDDESSSSADDAFSVPVPVPVAVPVAVHRVTLLSIPRTTPRLLVNPDDPPPPILQRNMDVKFTLLIVRVV